ncbi:hypothetical protein [Shewanella aestuarii]|uniref:Uncharacterized protein n=1 Tax=Shewanella aestuarii TaxID=1028752 RepID=A0A6G9QNG5_9GAMM|nr:hypothetical protein [Shewanella aestuarii]QIR15623.1 hypothetical protein HBH39_14960 [Shewanella aestuarii]
MEETGDTIIKVAESINNITQGIDNIDTLLGDIETRTKVFSNELTTLSSNSQSAALDAKKDIMQAQDAQQSITMIEAESQLIEQLTNIANRHGY